MGGRRARRASGWEGCSDDFFGGHDEVNVYDVIGARNGSHGTETINLLIPIGPEAHCRDQRASARRPKTAIMVTVELGDVSSSIKHIRPGSLGTYGLHFDGRLSSGSRSVVWRRVRFVEDEFTEVFPAMRDQVGYIP